MFLQSKQILTPGVFFQERRGKREERERDVGAFL
jgi:hypothetical protein